jgi:hypothetical protein
MAYTSVLTHMGFFPVKLGAKVEEVYFEKTI